MFQKPFILKRPKRCGLLNTLHLFQQIKLKVFVCMYVCPQYYALFILSIKSANDQNTLSIAEIFLKTLVPTLFHDNF